MTILVTGGAGYIGSHMAWKLLDHGEAVVVLDRLSTKTSGVTPPTIDVVVGDVNDQSLVRSLLRDYDIDCIMHFAASTIVPDSFRNPLGYYMNNTSASRSLIEAAIDAGVRYFIFSSTAAVYGNPSRTLVAESEPTRPASPYGTSKLMTEMMLRDASAASDLKYVTLRYFNVCGADPLLRTGQSSVDATHLFKVALEAALAKRRQVTIHGTDYPTRDGTCLRDYIHVSDLTEAHYGALAYLRAGGDSLVANCGYGTGYTVREVLETVKRVSGSAFEVNEGPRRQGDVAAIVADPALLMSTLNWQPKYAHLETMIDHALQWERKLSREE